jgi:hypothetical protein
MDRSSQTACGLQISTYNRRTRIEIQPRDRLLLRAKISTHVRSFLQGYDGATMS